MILVSSCLAGINCKYDGGNNFNEKVFNLVKEGKAIPVCAEQFGGLTTPRIASEIRYINGKRHVINKEGQDVTEQFEKGAQEILDLAKKLNVTKAILKAKSPSCGKGKIYNGKFNGELIDGNGILADLLIKNGIEIITENELD